MSLASASADKQGPVDHLQRFLNALKNSEDRRDGERRLADYVEAERRDLDTEAFSQLDKEIQDRISNLSRSNDPHDKRCALLAIDELIDVKFISESSARIARMSRSIKAVITTSSDPKLLKQAARTMGRLVSSDGALTADVVEREVKDALDRLSQRSHNSNEHKRLAACYMLKELADHAAAVFNVHVRVFIDVIWNALRDARLEVRQAAVAALRACLVLVETRETRYRVQWWYRLFEQTMRALVQPFNDRDIEAYVHASLLTLGELLEHTGEFMLARYKEAIDTTLKFRESKHPLVKQAVIALIPKMAAFAPEKFALSYLEICTSHLLGVLHGSQHNQSTAFVALGQMALALSKDHRVKQLDHRLADIAGVIREAVSVKHPREAVRRAACMEALQCVGVLAEALGEQWQPIVADLLKPMVLTGLSDPLVKSLVKVVKHLPSLVPEVQAHLLQPVLVALPVWVTDATNGAATGRLSRLDGGPASRLTYRLQPERHASDAMMQFIQRVHAVVAAQEEEEGGRKHKLVKLALHTLAEFDFGKQALLPFTRDVVLKYARHEDASIRRKAADAAWKIVDRQWTLITTIAHDGDELFVAQLPQYRATVEHIVARLFQMAVSDMDTGVRKSIMDALHSTFDRQASHPMISFLAQVESVRALRICLNDECHAVCMGAITLMGRLAALNSVAVTPTLRKHLHQLLTNIENALDSKHLEDSSALLQALIAQRETSGLIVPNVGLIQSKLVAKLIEARQRINARADGKSKSGHSMTTSILSTISALALCVSTRFRPFVNEVLPLIVEAICDTRMDSKRHVAVNALGSVVASTGMAIEPFNRHSQLLVVLLRMLHEAPSKTRIKVVEVLGIVGALDPHIHKSNQAVVSGEGKLDKDGVRGMRDTQHSDEYLLPANGLMTQSDDFYPTVAINALLKQLRDSKMAPHHGEVVQALMFIFKSLGLGSVTYLQLVLPVLFSVVHTCDEALQVSIFSQLVDLVGVVQGHVRRYLQDILQLVDKFWDIQRVQLLNILLNLLAQLARVLQDDFRGHVATLIPKFVSLFQEAERSFNFTIIEPGLVALQALGLALDEHFHLLLPSLVRLLPSVNATSTPLATRLHVLHAMASLFPRMRLAPYASAVLHPLLCTLRDSSGELQQAALNTICAVAVAIGPDMALFVPTIQEVIASQNIRATDRWLRLERHLSNTTAPCIADAVDWENACGWAAEMDSVVYNENTGLPPPAPAQTKFPVQQEALRRAWESSHRSTKDDWMEWMRHLSVELLCQSPSPALRACHQLAQLQPSMARELFAVGFVSCWLEIDAAHQQELVRSLEAALASPSIPPEIVTALLNLAEFMEHDERPLPLDTRTLGALAEKCNAFAKALHYKEIEFLTSQRTAVESLIHISNQLRQPDAAEGLLRWAQKHLSDAAELTETWNEKLGEYQPALVAYQHKLSLLKGHHDSMDPRVLAQPEYWNAFMGKLRCLGALAEWRELMGSCRRLWSLVDPFKQREIAQVAVHAAWSMNEWDMMHKFVDALEGRRVPTKSSTAFLYAVLHVKDRKYAEGQSWIQHTRELLVTELAALVSESYSRAYQDIVRAQQCAELTEVIAYHKAVDNPSPSSEATKELIRDIWRQRILGVERSVDVWQGLLSVRSLVLSVDEDQDVWLKFASMCRKEKRHRLARRTYAQLLGGDPDEIAHSMLTHGVGTRSPQAMFAYLKHSWFVNTHSEVSEPSVEQRLAVMERLGALLADLEQNPVAAELRVQLGPCSNLAVEPLDPLRGSIIGLPDASGARASILPGSSVFLGRGTSAGVGGSFQARQDKYHPPLIAKAYMRMGMWTWQMQKQMTDESLAVISRHLNNACAHADKWGKAWHNLAYFNVSAMDYYHTRDDITRACQHVVPAMHGFFQSIALNARSGGHHHLQDILRVLTLWFAWGTEESVQHELQKGFGMVSIDTWLSVVPQMMARIHNQIPGIKKLVFELLVKIGLHHPQALMYPLLSLADLRRRVQVAVKSASVARRSNAQAVVEEIRQHSGELVEQADLVSRELIRVAILWNEQWHESLEEASRQYFGEGDVQGMMTTLLSVHAGTNDGSIDIRPESFGVTLDEALMQKGGPQTMSEAAFVQAYGNEINEAFGWLEKYNTTKRDADLQQAWDLYYHIFKRINKQLPAMTGLDLSYVSPNLSRAQGLELAVPGTYIAGQPVVTIASFAMKLQVIASKQRPRKLTIHGGDGAEYQFLLKGHEDLRQDERVMQLFGLVNNLLESNRATAERDLSIARYAVIPLSPNCGCIGWVRNCDTLHALIREYRDSRKIPLNVEHRIMQSQSPDYDHLMIIQKVEIFLSALESTSGEDLHKVLWLKSRNSEVWLDRRTNYTRSMAVMSMVGYLLGLGDRHPSNIMLDRYSGKLVHIDFGDCFEASMKRDKFPEKVPFRLTRMMIKAMEVSGIEGNFSTTCKQTMEVLRRERESVMAMLEAFVHDPLINWRFIETNVAAHGAIEGVSAAPAEGSTSGIASIAAPHADEPRPPGARDSYLATQYTPETRLDATEVLNAEALKVMNRMKTKLHGTDFRKEGITSTHETLSVPRQVSKLIKQATSEELLCQSYIGWCPFW